MSLDRYYAGLLGDGGGGNVDWWQDYLRAELDRAHDFYAGQVGELPADAVGCAEREVGRYVYKLIEARMDAKAGTAEARELDYLAQIVADVEEYGADKLEVPEITAMPANGLADRQSLLADLNAAKDALRAARDGLSIAAGWARSKPDSGRAQDKISAGLAAIRTVLRTSRHGLRPETAR